MLSLHGRTVLIVDDEVDFRELLVFKFRQVQARVLEAGSGDEALEIANANHIDVIITDIRMQHGDGIGLLDSINKRQVVTPVVIIVSGFYDLPADSANQKGAVALFSKPCNLDDIVGAAQTYLQPLKERVSKKKDGPHLPLYLTIDAQNLKDCLLMPTPLVSIGRGGMFVAIEEKPAVGSSISFKITFGGKSKEEKLNGTVFEGTGICRWQRVAEEFGLPQGVGIEYTFLTEASFSALSEAFEDYNPVSFIPRGHQEI